MKSMKARLRLLLPALIASFGLMLANRVTAQTFTNLHTFGGVPNDGAQPWAGLILSGNTLYGTAELGGGSGGGGGTVFKVNTDGTGFTNLYSFITISGPNNPFASLILSDNTLYGTTFAGGGAGNGTVFAVNTDGTGLTNLHSFTAYSSSLATNSDGFSPRSALVLSGDTLYGTAFMGGSSGKGTVFSIKTNGTEFTNLHSFSATSGSLSTNYDGSRPFAGLILSGNILYGTATAGGSAGNGTVFAINTDGSGFTNLHNFLGFGGSPKGELVISSNKLYGTTYNGGNVGNGTVFAINTDGTGFTNLHTFPGGSGGATPGAGLVLSNNTLYGTTQYGGTGGKGTIFAINIDGTGFTTLYKFTNGDGTVPVAGLLLCGTTLYGTTLSGGTGNGTVFSLSLSLPQLTIIPAGTNVILTWPTYVPGVILQSTTNLVSPVIWISNPPAPVVVNGQNAVTNSVSGSQKFYRLSQ